MCWARSTFHRKMKFLVFGDAWVLPARVRVVEVPPRGSADA